MFTDISTYFCRRSVLVRLIWKIKRTIKRDTIHIETASSHSFPFQRSKESDRDVNCRLSLRENSRRRSQTARCEIPRELISLTPMIAVNWSGRPYQILDTCPYVVSQHMAPFIAVPPYSRSSVRGEWCPLPGCGPSRLGRWSLVRHAIAITAIYKYITCIMRARLFMRSADRVLVHRRKTVVVARV